MTWTGSTFVQIEAAASPAHVEVSRVSWFRNERHAPQAAAFRSSSWGGARSARGRRTSPRHAQPGIHEYTAQTLAGG
jgi:hypothetical protein